MLITFTMFICLVSAPCQEIKVYDFPGIEHRLKPINDSVYFINFWATWCVPCVKEIPALVQVAEEYKNQRVKFLLISMDFPKDVNKRLKPFIHNHNIKSEIVLLDDPDFNSWINKIDPTWSGGIPASLIITGKSRDFYEKGFEYSELKKLLNKKLLLLDKIK